ncbi:hypothetical protein JPSP22_19960 [Staphylococcus pseudintermedius]
MNPIFVFRNQYEKLIAFKKNMIIQKKKIVIFIITFVILVIQVIF